MKKYLKVGSAFDGGIGFSVRHSNEQVRIGTHAINSHDELVEMNKELLKTLKNALEECEFEIRHGGQVCVDTYAIRKAIEMAEGGAI